MSWEERLMSAMQPIARRMTISRERAFPYLIPGLCAAVVLGSRSSIPADRATNHAHGHSRGEPSRADLQTYGLPDTTAV